MAAKFETNDELGGVVSNRTGSSGESVLTQMLNAGIEALSAAGLRAMPFRHVDCNAIC